MHLGGFFERRIRLRSLGEGLRAGPRVRYVYIYIYIYIYIYVYVYIYIYIYVYIYIYISHSSACIHIWPQLQRSQSARRVTNHIKQVHPGVPRLSVCVCVWVSVCESDRQGLTMFSRSWHRFKGK